MSKLNKQLLCDKIIIIQKVSLHLLISREQLFFVCLKMVIKYHTENYEDFCTFMDNFDPKGQVVHILFEGAVDPVTKQSWCSDCVEGIYLYLKSFIEV